MKTSLLPASGMTPQDPSMHGRLISGKEMQFFLSSRYLVCG